MCLGGHKHISIAFLHVTARFARCRRDLHAFNRGYVFYWHHNGQLIVDFTSPNIVYLKSKLIHTYIHTLYRESNTSPALGVTPLNSYSAYISTVFHPLRNLVCPSAIVGINVMLLISSSMTMAHGYAALGFASLLTIRIGALVPRSSFAVDRETHLPTQ